jgi:two-component system chemotaxis response regulator CheB
VASAQAALDIMRQRKPDVVLMDEGAAGLGGVEATQRIMQAHAVPIVLNCTTNKTGASAFRALEAGAVACVDKPQHGSTRELEALAQQMRLTVRLMSEVKVVRRWARTAPATPAPRNACQVVETAAERGGRRVVGIGASTGGPMVLQTILLALPQPFDAPVLVVQHMARGFLQGLADWLTKSTGMQVQVAENGMVPQNGQVYLAPDACQMVMGPKGTLLIRHDTEPSLHQPSVAALFRSLAEVCAPQSVGVLLTGMGRDGAAELKLMRDHGAITIAQDQESSVVHGMPGEAIAMGAATYVLPAGRIAQTLASLIQPRVNTDAAPPP